MLSGSLPLHEYELVLDSLWVAALVVASFYCFASAVDAEMLVVKPEVKSKADVFTVNSNSALLFISELLVLESIDESVDDELVVKAKDP